MNDFLVLGGDKRSVYLIDEIIKNAKTCSYLFIDEKYIQNTLAKKEAGLKEAIDKIDSFVPLIDYDYELDDENNYQSWIKSKNLR